MQSFIETQFPVPKLSKESYKERTGHLTQTLGLGKWWGLKPLVSEKTIANWYEVQRNLFTEAVRECVSNNVTSASVY